MRIVTRTAEVMSAPSLIDITSARFSVTRSV
jgi:predicted aconitase